MDAFLKSTRLSFYYLTANDSAMMLALLNEPSFIQNIGDRGVRTLARAKQYLQDGPLASYQQHGYGMYHVVRQEDGASIGLCGLVRRDYLPAADLGYALFPEFTGYGYAQEAAVAVFQYGKTVLQLPSIVGIVQANNLASQRVLHKVGLRKQCTVVVPTTGETLDFYAENS